MLTPLWRFRASLLPGLLIAAGLLGFAGVLFGVLIHAGGGGSSGVLDGRIVSLVRFTLYQATLSTLLSLMIGLLLAWSLTHQPRFRGRAALIALFASSLVLPTLIVAFGIITVLGNHGWLNQAAEALTDRSFGSFVYGLGGILIAHVYLNGSFAAMGLLRAFESIPTEKYRLAQSLGLTPWQRFRTVEWIAIRGSLPSIGATIFMLCFSSFAIVLLLGGSPSRNTLEVAIYEAVRVDFDIPFALRLALIQLSISAVLVALASRLPVSPSNLQAHPRPLIWGDPAIWQIIQRTLIGLMALLYLLPLLATVLDGLRADLAEIITRPLFVRSLGMSLSIASVSALLTVVIALLLADARRHFGTPLRLRDTRLTRLLSVLITFSGNLYLAIPSLILGLGFFLIARQLGGSMVMWGAVAIVTANVLMSLPFALSLTVPALQKTARRYDKLVFSLGLTPWQRWRHAEWPYLRRIVGYVGALSFALSLGDLGVVALFGNQKITTLPWYLYGLMGSYRTQDAAGVALILLVLAVGVFWAAHYLDRGVSHAARG